MLHITRLKALGLEMRRPICLLERDMQIVYSSARRQQALYALKLKIPSISTLLKTT